MLKLSVVHLKRCLRLQPCALTIQFFVITSACTQGVKYGDIRCALGLLSSSPSFIVISKSQLASIHAFSTQIHNQNRISVTLHAIFMHICYSLCPFFTPAGTDCLQSYHDPGTYFWNQLQLSFVYLYLFFVSSINSTKCMHDSVSAYKYH